MCRQSDHCTELGTDPDAWDRHCPLTPKPWFQESLSVFVQAFQAILEGDTATALDHLRNTRGHELNQWFDIHAQNAGRFRARHFGEEPVTPVELDPVKSITKFEAALMSRDAYTCQYCRTRVFTGSELRAFRDRVGSENFRTEGSNKQRHGIKLVFSGTLDHVVPYKRGGRTSPENLVTCCWPCNYGKSSFTLQELGLVDPRAR